MNEQENTLDQQWAHQEEQEMWEKHRESVLELEAILNAMGVKFTPIRNRDGNIIN